MAIAEVSIRPNSIGFRDAVRAVHERVRAAAGDFDPPEETGEMEALRRLYEGTKSDREERLQRLQNLSHSIVVRAMLNGSLRAHFSDASEAADMPGWAWLDAERRWDLWIGGCLVLPAVLPDEWQRWSGEAVFVDRGQFDGWLAAHDFADPVPADTPEAFDAADKPEPVKHYPPPERPFVTLSQALSWIAFGKSFQNERLIRAIDEFAFGPADETNRKLENAVSKLAELALSEAVGIRGKYVADNSTEESAVLTAGIDPIRFHDFAQFDIHLDALRYGTGLTWMKSESISQLLLSKRSESIRAVAVNRSALVQHFPVPKRVADSGSCLAVESPFAWSDFDADSLPELRRLHDLASRDEWWTWPEAIAWIGSRESRNIATLRYWAVWWTRNGDSDPTVTLAAQAEIASRYCEAPRHAKVDLIAAVERGAVATAGRTERHGKSEPLAKGDWRGGAIVYEDGGAKLVSDKNRLVTWSFDIAVSRADLIAAFPSHEPESERTGGTLPANRQLNHDEIIRQAAAMKEAQPSLSKGSAAASIIADLGLNPKTSKAWDNRHIERIIGSLWQGGLA